MIARTWHGRVPAEKADAYHAFLLRKGLADYFATPGNRGVYVFRRVEGEVAHFLLTTFWESVEAIKRFAGEDHERARYYPEDDGFLLEKEPFVTHYEVLHASAEAAEELDAIRADDEAKASGREVTPFEEATREIEQDLL